MIGRRMSSGAVVMMAAPSSTFEWVILAEYERGPSGTEYVTGFVQADELPTATSWYWGHYHDGRNALFDAIEDFLARSTDDTEVIAKAVAAALREKEAV